VAFPFFRSCGPNRITSLPCPRRETPSARQRATGPALDLRLDQDADYAQSNKCQLRSRTLKDQTVDD
jgi:hypothetical protein